MSQVNINDPEPTPRRDDTGGARTAMANNLTWAIAMVLIIAAIAIAIVYVIGHVHF